MLTDQLGECGCGEQLTDSLLLGLRDELLFTDVSPAQTTHGSCEAMLYSTCRIVLSSLLGVGD